MSAPHFTNLLIVVAAGVLAPLALGFFPRIRLPAIVLEIVLGIIIGPSVLGWVKPDGPVSILALIGLAFLPFLSGLAIDVERLRAPILKLTSIGTSRREEMPSPVMPVMTAEDRALSRVEAAAA